MMTSTDKLRKEDYWNCWKLISDEGRQYWSFEYPTGISQNQKSEFLKEMSKAFQFDKKSNPNSSDLLVRHHLERASKLKVDADTLEKKAEQALNKGFDYYQSLITEAGHQPADYGGPLFLLPGLIFASYITNTPFKEEERLLMSQYIKNHQNEDGGWGLHIEGDSTMFGTVLNYVALRILGEDKENEAICAGRSWIHTEGGAQSIPPWGKFYLSLLNIYEWNGNNSLFPEHWKFPDWFPTHPSKYWNHARMVYLPMSYLYGKKYKMDVDDLITSLREEIYLIPFNEHKWKSYRDLCHPKDEYHPVHGIMKYFNFFVNTYEKLNFGILRKSSLKFISRYLSSEDQQSSYINLGPVNKVLNSIAAFIDFGPESEQFKKHVDRWKDYLWVAEDGMKMNGYNGSQFWDTAFGYQAISEAGYHTKFENLTKKYVHFIDSHQILGDAPSTEPKFYRDSSIGGFPFSTRAHDWPITDCTAEGVKCILNLNGIASLADIHVDPERLKLSIDLLLNIQNKDGGWASYELQRGGKWLEKLNPALIFTDIMIDYSFVECTSAVTQGLKKYATYYPEYRSADIKKAITRANAFLKSQQKQDGSFYGSWAVCYTYGTWFGIEGLLVSGEPGYLEGGSNEITKACEFIVSKQRKDGSWGEASKACEIKAFVEHETGQIINTAWAVMSLMAAGYPNKQVIDKGIKFIIQNQLESGDFPQQGISGVFNGSCMISYTSYRNVFPLWALARYNKIYNQD